MRRSLYLVLALGLGAAGCLRDPDIIDLDDDAPAVHAILETGADSAVVVVSRPAPADPGFIAFRGLSGAEVRLIRNGDTLWLPETPDLPCTSAWFAGVEGPPGAGCYRTPLPGPIPPGAVYRLEVRLPDGTRVTGEATAPPPVALHSPAPTARFTVECRETDTCYAEYTEAPPYILPLANIPVSWDTAGTGLDRFQVTLRSTAVYYQGAEYPGDACDVGYLYGGRFETRDSTDWAVTGIGCAGDGPVSLEPARFDSIRARLTVTGWPEAYVQYLDMGWRNGIREEAASVGLEGAYGVFTAFSTASREVLLVRDPPPG